MWFQLLPHVYTLELINWPWVLHSKELSFITYRVYMKYGLKAPPLFPGDSEGICLMSFVACLPPSARTATDRLPTRSFIHSSNHHHKKTYVHGPRIPTGEGCQFAPTGFESWKQLQRLMTWWWWCMQGWKDVVKTHAPEWQIHKELHPQTSYTKVEVGHRQRFFSQICQLNWLRRALLCSMRYNE